MRYVLIYGALAGAIAISFITASIAVESLSHLQSVWFGYLVMLAALSLIFVGVKRYRQPLLRMLITFSEILPVCVLVPLLSAAVLRHPRVLPGRVT